MRGCLPCFLRSQGSSIIVMEDSLSLRIGQVSPHSLFSRDASAIISISMGKTCCGLARCASATAYDCIGRFFQFGSSERTTTAPDAEIFLQSVRKRESCGVCVEEKLPSV